LLHIFTDQTKDLKWVSVDFIHPVADTCQF